MINEIKVIRIGDDEVEPLGFEQSGLFRALKYGADPERLLNREFCDASAMLTLDAMTRVVVEDICDETKEETFGDELSLATVGTNFSIGKIMLLELLAEELTDSHKDYHVVMRFIEKIKELCDKAEEIADEMEE